tara:strand:- start:354 stop:509 length:156 start_codon:yes stop_codon:yes gene_type:complete
MGVTQWAYTMITKAPEVTRKCESNRNVRSEGAERKKTTPKNQTALYPRMWC